MVSAAVHEMTVLRAQTEDAAVHLLNGVPFLAVCSLSDLADSGEG